MSQGEYIIILFIFMVTPSSSRHTMAASCWAAFLFGMTRNRDQQIHRPRSIFSRQAPYPLGRILGLALIRGRALPAFSDTGADVLPRQVTLPRQETLPGQGTFSSRLRPYRHSNPLRRRSRGLCLGVYR